MRDWLKAFLPASYRGVAFKVDIESTAGARRLSVSPIAYSETSVIEDMGRNPSSYDVTAYTAGDAADAQALPLIAALERRGAGTLVLPMLGPRRARVGGWSISRYKTRAGFVAIDISFIEEGLAFVPFSAGAAAGRLFDAMAAVIPIAALALGSAIAALPARRRNGVTLAAIESAALASATAPLSSDGVQPAAVRAALTTLSDSAPAAAADPQTYAADLFNAWRAIGRYGDAARVFDVAAADLLRDRDDTPIADIERIAICAAMAVAGVRRVYSARIDARTARQALGEASAPVIAAAANAFDGDLYGWISQITGEAALDISRSGADRAPMVRVETGISLPSTVLAHALYGDANRAGELVDRNGASMPALMPAVFEALAS